MPPDKHPGPPADIHARKLIIQRSKGPWFRVHWKTKRALFFGKLGSHRFDDPDGKYGVLYLGCTEACAFIETFGSATGINLVTTKALKQRYLTKVEAKKKLKLVDLSGPGLARIGADSRVTTGDEYDLSQRYSRALKSHPERPDGLLYRARHDTNELSVVLYDRKSVKMKLSSKRLGTFLDPDNVELLANILDQYGFGIK